MNNKYDSREDTIKHIERVREILAECQRRLAFRADRHDASKLSPEEKPIFDEFTPKLKSSTYGSDEYRSFLAAMKPALDHHYANNRHHPEHFTSGECIICFTNVCEFIDGRCPNCYNGQTGNPLPTVDGMSLVDLIEMLCDWKAASESHADGDIMRSIEINEKRFSITPQLKSILKNTAVEMEWKK